MATPTQRTFRLALIVLGLGLGAWGCGDDDYSGDGCTKDTDCDATQVCNEGTCASASGQQSNAASSNSTSSNATSSNSTSGGASNTAQSCDTPDAVAEPYVMARVYSDTNASDESSYVGGFEPGTDMPMGDVSFRMFAPGPFAPVETKTVTCADGQVAFGELEDGSYFISPELGDQVVCGQRNCPKRLPNALAEGRVKIVTFGDSVPVVGDSPFFPSRLATLFAPLAAVDNQNIAIGGTTSNNWLPSTNNFQNRLAPQLPDADVVMISLGGNDILAYVQSLFNGNIGELLADIPALIAAVTEEVSRIIDNILEIAAAIREINPTIDIVYILYPDYSLAQGDQLWGLVGTFVGADAVSEVLVSARTNIPRDSDIILIDIFGASEGLPLDDYLFDSLHFNSRGQTFYAEEIFKGLGGVLIGPSPLDAQPRTPLGLEASFSVQP